MTIPMKSPLPTAAVAPAANNYNDLNGLAALKKDPKSPAALHAVSQQIDALFLQMMLKSMRDAGAEIGESASNEMGMYQDMFDKQISLSMSQHQSLGLGAQLTRQLAAAAGAADPASKTGPASNTVPARGASSVPSQPPVDADGRAGDTSNNIPSSDPSEFVSQVYPAIQRAAQALGVNPLAILAQAALETGWGKRMPRSSDGTPSHNLFGIKADDNWNGPRVAADTVEFSGGVVTQRRTAFRAYGSVEDSVDDFARLLSSSPRYRDAVAGGASTQGYVAGIGKSGYATDPQYANKLNDILNSSTFRNLVSKRRGTLET
jgi:peptidoglycan hydrolase FlgJ